MIYETIDSIPDNNEKELIKDLISDGVIEADGDKINLEESIYKTLLILAKLGII